MGINDKQSLFNLEIWPAPKGTSWNQESVMYRSNDFRLGQEIDPKAPNFEAGLYKAGKEYEPFAEPQDQQLPPLIFDESAAAAKADTAASVYQAVRQGIAQFAVGEKNVNDDGDWNRLQVILRRDGHVELPRHLPAGLRQGPEVMSLATKQRAPHVPARRRGIKDPAGDRAVQFVSYCLLAMFTLSVLYPLIYVLSSSLSSGSAISSAAVKLWPIGFNVDAYKTIFTSPNLFRGFLNSFGYTIGGALIGTVLTVLCGYPLSRNDMPFRRTLTLFFLIPTLFSAGIVPTYILVRSLGLLDSVWAILLPGAMSVFNVLITRTFYQMTIPKEMLEAARVDGASDFSMLVRIALPLSKPIIAVNMLFYGVAQWNGWFNAFLYLTSQDLYPLQLVLRDILANSAVNPAMIGGPDVADLVRRKELFDKLKYALIVVSMVPPLIAYPFVQKHFVKGVLIGAVK